MNEVPFFACCDLINGLLSDLTPSGRSEPRSAVFLVPLLASPIGVVLSTGMPWRCADSVLFWKKYYVAVRLLFVFAYCAAASFCIILHQVNSLRILCWLCWHVDTCGIWRSSGFVPWRPSKRNRQRRSRREMDPMDQKMLPQVVSESVTNFAAAQKIVAVVGPCWTMLDRAPRTTPCTPCTLLCWSLLLSVTLSLHADITDMWGMTELQFPICKPLAVVSVVWLRSTWVTGNGHQLT